MTGVNAPAQARGGAIVLSEHIRGLGVVRSLGRRGIPVWTVAPSGDVLSAGSRYSRRSLPWPRADERAQLEYLLTLAERHHLEGWTLFATSDETTAFCARHAAELSASFRTTVPPWHVLRWAYDKRLTYQLAKSAGVDQPLTIFPVRPHELSSLPIRFPVVLKPAFKKDVNRFTRDKAWDVDSLDGLRARYEEAQQLVGPDIVMMQELIPGGGETQFSYAAFCVDGEPLASVTARRTRQYPVDFGHSSSFVETIENPRVEEAAARVLAAMRYTGIAEVEFKYDSRDDRYKLLEVNPRSWTWHGLCRRAGVDFPYLLWCAAHGERISPLRGRPGVRWVRVSTDLAAACIEIGRGRLTPAAYLRSLKRPIEFATFAADDPLPGLLDIVSALRSRFAPPSTAPHEEPRTSPSGATLIGTMETGTPYAPKSD